MDKFFPPAEPTPNEKGAEADLIVTTLETFVQALQMKTLVDLGIIKADQPLSVSVNQNYSNLRQNLRKLVGLKL
jgi:hypothetical protein